MITRPLGGKLPQADDDGDGENNRFAFLAGDIGLDYSITSKAVLA